MSERLSDLALLGGRPLLARPLAPFNTIGEAERRAVERVLDTGVLSGFIGAPGPDFNGGPAVRELEARWRERFDCAHAVSVNSATSGLYAAIGAAGVGPGDEVIVPPYTMSATCVAPLVYGGIPVFVDIERDHFCLDPDLVEAAITPKTRAILTVNLFGHPSALARLRNIADDRGLVLIEDNAQGPLAKENGRFAGTIGHIGVFSLNRHKHIQTGEGGICATDDAHLADCIRAIRNHGENLVDDLGLQGAANIIGFNYRLSELSAAVGIAQLDKSEEIIADRIAFAEALSQGVADLEGITAPPVRAGCDHVYYVWAGRLDSHVAGLSRDLFVKALAAEGVPIVAGYVKPMYLLATFRDRVAVGRNGWPFDLTDRTYAAGLCPVTEHVQSEEIFYVPVCSFSPTPEEVRRIVDAFGKVFSKRDALREASRSATEMMQE